MLHLIIRIQFNWLTLVFGHHLKCDQILYLDGALPLKKLNTTRDLKYKGLQKQEMSIIIQNNEKKQARINLYHYRLEENRIKKVKMKNKIHKKGFSKSTFEIKIRVSSQDLNSAHRQAETRTEPHLNLVCPNGVPIDRKLCLLLLSRLQALSETPPPPYGRITMQVHPDHMIQLRGGEERKN